MHVCGHEDVTTRKCSAWDQKPWAMSALEAHAAHDMVGIHQVGLVDRLGDRTGYKKVRSCDICHNKLFFLIHHSIRDSWEDARFWRDNA